MSYSEAVLPENAETLSPRAGYIRNPKQYDLPGIGQITRLQREVDTNQISWGEGYPLQSVEVPNDTLRACNTGGTNESVPLQHFLDIVSTHIVGGRSAIVRSRYGNLKMTIEKSGK